METRQSPEVEAVLSASDLILRRIEEEPGRKFDPAELVNEFAPAVGRYSAKAAILNLLELKQIKLEQNWYVSLNRALGGI
ncbi:MAG TPA: hypothetical protein PK819_06420 [Thermomicrobiales bacterium]|nr:hypothetical protein [Thermomicrobiales bacterium]